MAGESKKSQQVYLWLRAYIDENKFSNKRKLPSENALRNRLSVSRETVRVALERLERERLIYRVKGSGTFINKEAALGQELGTEGEGIKIGLILQGQDGNANSGLLEGIRSVIPMEQVDLRVYLTDNKFANERRCLQEVMHQNFSGFIVDGVKASMMNPNLDCYKQIYERHIPVIFYNNYYKNLNYPKVIGDEKKCADYLLRLLIQAGHRKIAGIFIYDNYQSVEKFQGMVATMKKYDVEFQDDYIKWCVSDEAHTEGFVKVIEKFLKKIPSCTAIVCCNYMIYCLVKQALGNYSKGIPEDYSVVCFDYSRNDWEQEKVACSIHQGYQIGRQVATRLMKMIERRDCEEKHYSYIMPPKLFEGNSVRQVGKKSEVSRQQGQEHQ